MPYMPTPNVVIEPVDPLVQKAVNAIKQLEPNFFAQVEKIVVHFGGGAGQLGHVARGPNENPRAIHIYKDRIKGIIQQQLGGNLTAPNFEDAVKIALMEVLAHEKTHIGEKPEETFLGEPEAESGAKQLISRVPKALAKATLDLENIREKYAPSAPATEPNLAFMIFSFLNYTYGMTKLGLDLLRSNVVSPAIIELKTAHKQNINKIKQLPKQFGYIEQQYGIPNSLDFTFNIAHKQAKNNQYPTGEMPLIKTASVDYNLLPNNFGVVIPDKLYRGSVINKPEQLRALKDYCNIERVISLHDCPITAQLCSLVGIEYIPAFMEQGLPNEQGRTILGEHISDFLLEKPTYIHCYYGQDRTGGVIARFRTEQGWPAKLAYLEAKAYGFKAIFADFIDWFCEPNNEKPPVDTDEIRKKLHGMSPYDPPPQCLIEPSPTDKPFGSSYYHTPNTSYMTIDDMTGDVPMTLAPLESVATDEKLKAKIEKMIEELLAQESKDMEILTNTVGQQRDMPYGTGYSVEPFYTDPNPDPT